MACLAAICPNQRRWGNLSGPLILPAHMLREKGL